MSTSSEIWTARSGAGDAAAARPVTPGQAVGTAAVPARSGLRLGIVNPEAWTFLHGLHGWLEARHETTVFSPRTTRAPFFRERLERRRLRADLHAFLGRHDVVFFEWATDLLALAASLPRRCAIVARLHRYELYTWADRIDWNAVDHVILVSAAKAREFGRRFPAHAHKTTVVPVGVPLGRYPFAARPYGGVIGTLCHISPRKRVYDLILALAGPLRDDPGLTLRVGGRTMPEHRDYDEAIRRLVRQLGLTDRVRFDGAIERAWEWYPEVDVFVSHSYSEGLQVAPAEAMATGCYTLAHDWEGADELLPADCRYVTDAEMAAKIRAYASQPPDARQAERRRMRALAEARFDADRAHAAVDAVLREAARA